MGFHGSFAALLSRWEGLGVCRLLVVGDESVLRLVVGEPSLLAVVMMFGGREYVLLCDVASNKSLPAEDRPLATFGLFRRQELLISIWAMDELKSFSGEALSCLPNEIAISGEALSCLPNETDISRESLSCLPNETDVSGLFALEMGMKGSFVGMSLLASACVSIRFLLGGGMGGGGEGGQGEPSDGDPLPLDEEMMESDSVSPSSDITVWEESGTASSWI